MAKPKNVPRSDEQAEAQIARIGVLEREIAAADVKRKGAVALLEEQLAAPTKPMVEEKAELIEGLRLWAEANRDRLTGNGKKKSAQLLTGKIAWTAGRKTLEIAGDEADVIAEIERRIVRLTRTIASTENVLKGRQLTEEREAFRAFLRETTALNRAAMKDRPKIAETLDGVRIVTAAEAFDVKPLASQIQEIA